MPAATEAPLRLRAACAVVCGAIFALVYNLTNHSAATGAVGRWYAEWELAIPLVDWMIVPYWSLDLLFVGGFLVCTGRAELRSLSRRVVAATLIAAAGFIALPLEPGYARSLEHGMWSPLFAALYAFDQPHNLFPSLHVAFALILHATYARHLNGLARRAAQLWFALVAASTVLVHQHHLIDVAGGAALGVVVMHLVDEAPLAAWRIRATRTSRRLSLAYASGALALAIAGTALGGWWLLLWWPGLALGWVAAGYAGLGSRICRPRTAGPSIPARIVLLPWLEALGWSRRWWWRRPLAPSEIVDGVWIGRIPDVRDWRGAVIDCSCEHRRRRPTASCYERVPLLDLALPEDAALHHLAQRIEHHRRSGEPVLVVCGLGLGRSALAVAAWLVVSGRASSATEAVTSIARRRPAITLGTAARAALDRLMELQPRQARPRIPHVEPCPAA